MVDVVAVDYVWCVADAVPVSVSTIIVIPVVTLSLIIPKITNGKFSILDGYSSLVIYEGVGLFLCCRRPRL
jgi:hypothetical protein